MKRGLPSIPSTVKNPGERSFLKAVKDILETLTGARGNNPIAFKADLDKLSGTTTIISGGGTYADISEIPGYDNLVNSISSPYDDESVPPAPLGVVGSATVGTAYLSWSVPVEDYIEVVEIWKQGPFTSQQVGLVRENAFLAGTAPARGGVFADPTEQGAWNYYWVRYRSLFGKVGAWHSVTAIEVQNAQAPDYLLSALSGQLTNSELSAALENRIALTETDVTTLQGQMTGATGDITTLYQNDADFTLVKNEVQAARSGSVDLAARIQTVEVNASNATQVVASDLLTLDTAYQLTAQKVTEQGALWHVTQDVNGYVTGFGVYNNGTTSQALFRVDQFGVGSPGASNLTFVVDGSQVVMSGAYIQDATVTNAKIQSLNVDKIVGDTASFVQANIGTLTTSDISGLNASFITANVNSLDVAKLTGNKASFVAANAGSITVNTANIATAAVDTLKIAGNAVTALQYSEHATKYWIYNYGKTRIKIATFYFNHGHTSSVNTLITHSAFLTYDKGSPKPWVYLLIGGTYYYPKRVYQMGESTWQMVVSLPPGNNQIDVYSSAHDPGQTGTPATAGEYWIEDQVMTFQAAKR